MVLGQPEPVGVDDVGVVVHLVGLEYDDHAAALQHLGRGLDPQADPDLVGEVRVLGILGLTVEPVEAATSHRWGHRHLGWPGHRVGHRVEQLPDQVLGVVDRRVAVGAGARQGAQPVVVIGLQRPDAPGVAGLREPDPPGRDQLHRQQRGAAEQADRGVRVVDPIALVSTGMAPRMGIRMVRVGPENSTSLSRGGWLGTQVARPCNGTKLNCPIRLPVFS